MSNIVTDAIGIPASVGDTVVFAPGQRGAEKMLTGKIERITTKGVIIGVDEKYRSERWSSASNYVVRKRECFVIVFKKEY
jgi:hypothetical protein